MRNSPRNGWAYGKSIVFQLSFGDRSCFFFKRGNDLHLLNFDKERKAELVLGMETHEERSRSVGAGLTRSQD